jgi:ferritin-like metal-binding protein YciE
VEPTSAIATVRRAFLVDLSELLAAERTFANAMPEMFSLARDQRVRRALQQHIAETQQQIDNVERAFAALGAEAAEMPCRAALGLAADFRSKVQLIRSAPLIDGCIVASGLKVEHLEIASYRPLVERAGLIGPAEVERLLQQNLTMEERFAQLLEQTGRQLGQQVMPQHAELVGAR